mgnify:CR=1 FL=1
MRNIEWVALNDAQRGQLIAMWLLAADRDGQIPSTPSIIKTLCYMTKEPDLKLFINLGFIDVDDSMTPDGCQHDANMTQQSREETEKSRVDTMSGKPDDVPVNNVKNKAKDILLFLNDKTGDRKSVV